MRIKEIVVVEGKNDISRVQQFFDVDMVSVSGQGLNENIFKTLEVLAKTRGLIILTDPDHQGDKIRALINERIPGCKNAFVDKKSCRTKNDIGIEHATEASLKDALENLVSYHTEEAGTLSSEDLVALGLVGYVDSKQLREFVATQFHLGYCNGKMLLKRLNMLKVSREQLEKVVTSYNG